MRLRQLSDISPDRGRRRQLLAVFLLLGALGLPGTARATGLDAMVAQYNKHPDAALAWRIAQAYRDGGHIGKAMNWGERVMVSPGLSPSLQRKVGAMRDDLRWDLRDAGYGQFKLIVQPAWASVVIDEQEVRPRRAIYQLWLPEGGHQLSVSAPDHAPLTRAISASRGELRDARIALSLTRPPELRLDVVPPNCEVWVNKRFVGHATRRVVQLEAGSQLVELRAPGYDPYVKTYVMQNGDRQRLVAELNKTVEEHMKFRVAAGVDRKLTPLELANHGERHRRLGRSQTGGVPAMHRGAAGPEAQAQADAAQPLAAAPAEARDEDEFAEVPTAELELQAGASSGGSSVFKGLLWTGIGLATVAGGVGTSLYGVSSARAANDLRLGHKSYAEYYEYAEQMAWVGYGAAAVGGVATVIGGAYLFGDQGLSRRGKGWLLTAVGAVAGGVGAWLMIDAVGEAERANGFKEGDANYDPNFDGAESLWQAGAISAATGGLLALGGLYLVATRARSASTDGQRPLWQRVALSPQLAPDHAGATMSWRW